LYNDTRINSKAIPHGAKQLLEIFTNIDNPF